MSSPIKTTPSSGDFVSLKTHNFKNALDKYKAQIAAFETILERTDKTIDNLLGSWAGRGRDAFRSDMHHLSRCFEDLHENMHVLKDTLISSEEAYMAADSETKV